MRYLYILFYIVILSGIVYSDNNNISASILTSLSNEKIIVEFNVDPDKRVIYTTTYGIFNCCIIDLWKLLNDYESFVNFMPKMEISAVTEKKGNTTYVYYKLDLPWPLRDPEYLTENISDDDNYILKWTTIPERAKNITINDGIWRLIRVGNKTIMKEDLKMAYPHYAPLKFVCYISRTARLKTFTAVRKELERRERGKK